MLLAILIPWLSFIINGKILRGIVCFILQITIIGWIPAAIWAVSSRNNSIMDKKLKQMEKKIIDSTSKK
jgi:TM2 domain-containing membrane protein YozV